MEAHRFDSITRLFANRRLSRRHALARAATGLATGALAAAGLTAPVQADDAAPATPAAEKDGPTMLFLQAFRAGSVAPKADAEGRYVLTLEHGLGQTVYFSDRPERIVGATPTPRFLEGLGFPDDNPPNAALVVETEAGATEVAVLELFNPAYEEATHTATYEVAVLGEWERTAEAGFTEAVTDLAALGSSFGAAHLFIDDCPNGTIVCYTGRGWPDPVVEHGRLSGVGYCWHWDLACCKPCDPNWYDSYAPLCNQTFASCEGDCWASMLDPALACAE